MRLAVGDAVVYGAHGVGHIAARKEQVADGVTREVVVLELDDGLTVTLPLERAREQLRPVASKADVTRLRETLREDQISASIRGSRAAATRWRSSRRERSTDSPRS